MLSSLMLRATPFGPTRPSTRSARSFAILHSGLRDGSTPFSRAFSLKLYSWVSLLSSPSTYCRYVSLISLFKFSAFLPKVLVFVLVYFCFLTWKNQKLTVQCRLFRVDSTQKQCGPLLLQMACCLLIRFFSNLVSLLNTFVTARMSQVR